MRRGLYWFGVLAGVVLLAAGVVVGALGYTAATGAAGVVRGYFEALARSDAAQALAYGSVPPGPHELLTSEVLREQQRIAPLRDFSVVSTRQHGSHASVEVAYVLAFAGEDVPVSARVAVHKNSGDWRLDAVAVATELSPDGARQRESILGAAIPTGTTLLFPGALPIRLDTPYLALDPVQDNVTFGNSSLTDVVLQVSGAGRAAVLHAVRAGLRRCLRASADPACPLPDERYVPGSIRGSVKDGLRGADVTLDSHDPVGSLRFRGKASVAGTWQRLDFANRRVTGRGTVVLDLHALAYAKPPLVLRWEPA